MNKLEKWLWVNCTLKDNGQNSNSLYFYYKNLEIRYSDHMAKQSTGELQIIKSSVFDCYGPTRTIAGRNSRPFKL